MPCTFDIVYTDRALPPRSVQNHRIISQLVYTNLKLQRRNLLLESDCAGETTGTRAVSALYEGPVDDHRSNRRHNVSHRHSHQFPHDLRQQEWRSRQPSGKDRSPLLQGMVPDRHGCCNPVRLAAVRVWNRRGDVKCCIIVAQCCDVTCCI